MERGKKIVIVGHGGSGKDYLVKKFSTALFTPNVSYTTRQPREGEVDGKDYHFITREKFEEMIEADGFQEWDEFNGSYYGTGQKEWEECDIFIKTPRGIDEMTELDRSFALVIYLDIPRFIRSNRLSARNGYDDSVERRLEADEQDFAEFTDFDIRIDNPKF